MDDEQKPLCTGASENGQGDTPRTGGRRRFLGAGTAVTPFLLTLAAQPALGVTCFTPSRSLSRNTSLSQAAKNGTCVGALSVSNFASGTGWDGTSISPDTPFHNIFSKGTMPWKNLFVKDDGVTSRTLQKVLQADKPQNTVAPAFIAAYLNIKRGVVQPLAVAEELEKRLIAMWAEWALSGAYSPSAGINWGEGQILTYLSSNGLIA